MPIVGTCLCGQTKVSLNSTYDKQVLCHCWDCKRTNGSAFSSIVLAHKKDVTITGPIKTYEGSKGDSGNTVSRVFCGVCGCPISHVSASWADKQAIQTGIFPVFTEIPIGAELYVKSRWHVLAAVEGAAQIQGAR